mmetsp:Transcript_72387/g.209586  ORF Transcript_72387/g.209586 Transcript_72387/m.209586 type:complete len:281 (-) Transcript_72387:72-914(-)
MEPTLGQGPSVSLASASKRLFSCCCSMRQTWQRGQALPSSHSSSSHMPPHCSGCPTEPLETTSFGGADGRCHGSGGGGTPTGRNVAAGQLPGCSPVGSCGACRPGGGGKDVGCAGGTQAGLGTFRAPSVATPCVDKIVEEGPRLSAEHRPIATAAGISSDASASSQVVGIAWAALGGVTASASAPWTSRSSMSESLAHRSSSRRPTTSTRSFGVAGPSGCCAGSFSSKLTTTAGRDRSTRKSGVHAPDIADAPGALFARKPMSETSVSSPMDTSKLGSIA